MKMLIQTPTNNLNHSLEFYRKLGFQHVDQDDLQMVSDGKALISINPQRTARAGVRIFADNWEDTVSTLRGLTEVVDTDSGYLFADPSGMWVYLETGPAPELPDLSNVSPSILGNYMGVSLESIGFDKSLDIWKLLGFKVQMGAAEQGWIALGNEEGFGISLMKPMMCPHLFFNPSLTYFNGGNNLEVIANIRAAGIPITEEITQFNKEGIADNVIIRDPGGFGFFVFND